MKKVYVNEEVCIGCYLCQVYCQLKHSKYKDLIKAFKKESPQDEILAYVEMQDGNGSIKNRADVTGGESLVKLT